MSAAPTRRAAIVRDRDGLRRLLAELSPLSSFQRFFVGGVRPTDRLLDRLLVPPGGGRAFVAVDGARLAGHAMWARRIDNARRAEIAFVVAEDHRRQGIATGLARLALADAARHGVDQVEATVLADNLAAHAVIRAVLPHAVSITTHGETEYVAVLTPDAAPVVCRTP